MVFTNIKTENLISLRLLLKRMKVLFSVESITTSKTTCSEPYILKYQHLCCAVNCIFEFLW